MWGRRLLARHLRVRRARAISYLFGEGDFRTYVSGIGGLGMETPCPISVLSDSIPISLAEDPVGNNHGLRLDFVFAVPDFERPLAESTL